MHKRQVTSLFGQAERFSGWAGEVRRTLDREYRALQVSHQDAAFLATTKGDAYQHLVAVQPAPVTA